MMFIVNVEAAIKKNDKWLIIERSEKEEHAGGMLSLVGGKVDKEGNSSDKLERTVEREILEEVGVKVKNEINYVHSTSFVTDRGENVLNIVFLCEHDSGEAFPKSRDEVEKVLWLTTEEILSNPRAPINLQDSIKLADSLDRNTYKKIYMIRHCEADGQPAEAQLTERGLKQALDLSELFSEIKIDSIISSPYKRAIQSIQPLAKRLNVEIEIDSKLRERVLSTKSYSDWLDKLKNNI